jgi:HAD superfamily hydrolase (TIGR01509 family)
VSAGFRAARRERGLTACLFDLDGTLWDSLGLWRQIDQDCLGRRGLALPEDYPGALAVLALPEAARYTIDRFGWSDTVEALVAEWQAMALEAYSHTIELRPHVKDYLHELRAAGVNLAVVTSLSPSLLWPGLERHGLTALFDVVCTAEEAGQSKRSPAIYRLAARRLGVAPGRCLVFEDVRPAVLSARAAGMTVRAVWTGQDDWPAIARAAHGVVTDYRLAPAPASLRRGRVGRSRPR